MNHEDIESILTKLGYELDDRGEYWQTNALYRGGDNRTALQIYKDTGVWKDYVEETGFLPFKALLEKSAEASNINVDELVKNIELSNVSEKKETNVQVIEEVFDKEELLKLLPHFDFYNKRGVTDEVLKKTQGGLSTQGQMYQRFVFPIYNRNKSIIGFAGRDMSNKEGRPKWKHIGKKTKWSYPYFHPNFSTQEWQNQNIILVESIGDFLAIEENLKENCLVTFGLDISPALITTLIEINPKSIVLSFNNDSNASENRGLHACIKNHLKLLSFFDANKIKICLPLKNDFGEMNKSDFKKWTDKKNKIINTDQRKDVYLLAKKLENQKKISKNLSKKINLIYEQ